MSAAPKPKARRSRRKLNLKEPIYPGMRVTDADNVPGPYTIVPPELFAQVEQDERDFPYLAPTTDGPSDLMPVKTEPTATEAESKLDGYLLKERCFHCCMTVTLKSPYNLCLRCHKALWKKAAEEVDKRAFPVPRAEAAGHVQKGLDEQYALMEGRVASLNGGATPEGLFFPQASKMKLPKESAPVIRTLFFFDAPKRSCASHGCVSQVMGGGLCH